MLMQKEREQVIEYCIKMVERGLTIGTSGNVSVFDREKGLYAISPSDMDYYEIKPEDVVIMDLDGNVVDGDRKPSSEHCLHRIFYKKRDDINAVIHNHAKAASVCACLYKTIPPIHEMIVVGGADDVIVSPFTKSGGQALADVAYEYMKGRNALLIGSHGMVTGGADLKEALFIAEEIEFCCDVYLKAAPFGGAKILTHEDVVYYK